MKTVKIDCDGCGADLTYRTNSVDYRLVLDSESKPGYGSGAYTDMMIYPPVERAFYFCNLQCLDTWREREHYFGRLWADWWAAWKTEHGTKHAVGYSYPEPDREITKAKQADFRAAALKAVPMSR